MGGLNGFANSSSFVNTKRFWLMVCVFAFCATRAGWAQVQPPAHVSAVKRIAIDWAQDAKPSAAVRERVVQKLESLGKLEVVQNPAQADAVLRGSATIWKTGHISTSPRSKAAEEVTYEGYATAELNDKNGKTLWSYLVTPKRSGWEKITDDLGDQLANALVAAINSKASKHAPPDGSNAALPGAKVNLQGAGATFPAPIYQKWFESFEQTRPEIHVTYDAVGSEDGMRRIRAEEVDFAASDMPLTGEQLVGKNGKLLQFATVLGAVVPIYNVDGAADGLNLTPEVLAGIFLGKIRSWNAPEIRAINRHVRLPKQKIVVVHRSDGSGTTYAWTDYLSKISEEWKGGVGTGTTVSWPVGIGAERNEGMAQTVRKTPNSIGYVEFIYALQHELSFAAVRNASGDYVKADLDSVTAAGKTAVSENGSEFQKSITNAGGKHVYPIASFTWILIPAKAEDPKKQKSLRDLLQWMLTSGQRQCQSLGYAPLPGDLAARELQSLDAAK